MAINSITDVSKQKAPLGREVLELGDRFESIWREVLRLKSLFRESGHSALDMACDPGENASEVLLFSQTHYFQHFIRRWPPGWLLMGRAYAVRPYVHNLDMAAAAYRVDIR